MSATTERLRRRAAEIRALLPDLSGVRRSFAEADANLLDEVAESIERTCCRQSAVVLDRAREAHHA